MLTTGHRLRENTPTAESGSLAQQLLRALEQSGSMVTQPLKNTINGLPMGRLATPLQLEEVAASVARHLWMFSPDRALALMRQIDDATGGDFCLAPRQSVVNVEDEAAVVSTRNTAVALATRLGFQVIPSTKLATAVSELARNIAMYAGRGQIEFDVLFVPRRGIRARAMDNGPGIPHIEEIMAGRYRSRSGLGAGLRGTKAVADEFQIETAPGKGTTVTITFYHTHTGRSAPPPTMGEPPRPGPAPRFMGAPPATPRPLQPSSAPRAGEANRFELVHKIGQGGIGEVWVARAPGVGGSEKQVAVRKISPQLARQPSLVAMLFAEARAQGRLHHPNIVQIYDVVADAGAPLISMEYVRGLDLATLMKLMGESLPPTHALRIAAEVATALDLAHRFVDLAGTPHPVLHRDVSPCNILLSSEGGLKLSDFGVAKVAGELGRAEGASFRGKPQYAAPEALEGKPIDGRADLFSLGGVLYELLTRKVPAQKEDETTPPRLANAAVPETTSALVMRALAKRPEDRFQTGRALSEALEDEMQRQKWRSTPLQVWSYFEQALGGKLAALLPSAGWRGVSKGP